MGRFPCKIIVTCCSHATCHVSLRDKLTWPRDHFTHLFGWDKSWSRDTVSVSKLKRLNNWMIYFRVSDSCFHVKLKPNSKVQCCFLGSKWYWILSKFSWWFKGLSHPIHQIIRYSNSWDQIVLFVFCIWSISDLQIIFKYLNSCHLILNSSRSFRKQGMYR